MHKQPAVGYPEVKQTLNMICQYYYWPAMREEKEQYLRNCYVCKQAKAFCDVYNILFQLFRVSKRPWVDLTIDFVVDLPNDYNLSVLNQSTFSGLTFQGFAFQGLTFQGLNVCFFSCFFPAPSLFPLATIR